MKQPKSILITGASSGIGAALATAYAAPGVTLALGGRNLERLGQVAAACAGKGARAEIRVLDVTDRAGMAEWITRADAEASLDLVIANAGAAIRASPGRSLEQRTHDVFAVNVTGVFNTVFPALDKMRGRGAGQIGIVSSIAGYHGLGSSPAYSASKVAVKGFGEAMRGLYHRDGIGISVICPGYVSTPMTAPNKRKMPLLMDADRAAAIIQKGLARNAARITFPRTMAFAAKLATILPESWVDPVFRLAPEDQAR